MPLRLVAVLAAALTLGLSGAAVARPTSEPIDTPSGPPKLIVALVIDQLSADLFTRYRRYFTAGLARLQRGAVFPSGYQSHASTKTCPGHATLSTGVRPARSGVVSNYWFDLTVARDDKRIYCVEDERDPASSPFKPVVSARHLKVPTLGDRMKAAWPASRNVVVAGKDRSAIMMGGHAMDAAYWWNGSGFATLRGRPLTSSAQAQNAAAAAIIARGAPALALPAWCAPADAAVPVREFTIGTGHFPLRRGDSGDFSRSPWVDAATGELAMRLIDEMDLGRREAPDILSISFSATDPIGHGFGHAGAEMCIQLAELDRTIGSLFAMLDARKIDYAVVLSADHGGIDAPERLRRQAYPAATRADKALLPAALARSVTEMTGIEAASGRLLFGDGASGDYYIARELTAEQRSKVETALVALLERHPQVAAVFTARQLAASPIPRGSPQDWTLLERARASFDPDRSGDVVSFLKRGVVAVSEPIVGLTATHGSIWDYDRRVPILFWRRGLAGFEQPAPVETVDIVPSLAALLGLDVPLSEFDGRCLDLHGGAHDTCSPSPPAR